MSLDMLPESQSKPSPETDDILLRVRDLKVHFPGPAKGLWGRSQSTVKAVDGISFDIRRGETLGVVGESGCGKSTTGLAMLSLIPATAGSVEYDGRECTTMSASDLRALRCEIQMVYQDPYSSLNPRMSAREIVREPLVIHGLYGSRAEQNKRVDELLDMCGLSAAMGSRYPHEFSGGQRQRLGIARALAVSPKFIVCDEPVSALDVSIQAQIVNLMEDLQGRLGLTFMFVAHDLAVVKHISDRIMVMYLGKVVEIADKTELYANPRHPYTEALMSAIPIADPVLEAQRSHKTLQGEVPSPMKPPSGCRFHPRCPKAQEICGRIDPELQQIGKAQVACHFAEA